MTSALFVSHGSPTLVIEDQPANRFLRQWGAQHWNGSEAPRAVLAVSAHWETDRPEVSTAARPETIHDFYGFQRQMYELSHPAAGDPALAEQVMALLNSSGLSAVASNRGLDHGTWVPLSLMDPQATLPVVSLSLCSGWSPARLYAMGQALQPLREQGVVLLASGAVTHNLRDVRWEGGPPLPEVTAFADWVRAAVERGDAAALIDYRQQAPFARRCHPRDEHLLPLFVAMGWGERGVLAHTSCDRAALRMDAYAFD